MHLLTLWPWPLKLQNHIISRISQGHSLYQVWTHWDHSFLSYDPVKQTNRRTWTSFPHRPTLLAWVITHGKISLPLQMHRNVVFLNRTPLTSSETVDLTSWIAWSLDPVLQYPAAQNIKQCSQKRYGNSKRQFILFRLHWEFSQHSMTNETNQTVKGTNFHNDLICKRRRATLPLFLQGNQTSLSTYISTAQQLAIPETHTLQQIDPRELYKKQSTMTAYFIKTVQVCTRNCEINLKHQIKVACKESKWTKVCG